jgi:Flp pilus assembly protein CpaB
VDTTIDDARRIERRHNLLGGRAVLGGLLITLAALGVFLTYLDASGDAGDAVLIAAADIHLGQVIASDDLRVVHGSLPATAQSHVFSDRGAVVGRSALGPIRAGELVQAGAVSADTVPADGATHEVALTLPRPQVAVGRLRQGDRVDIYVTTDTGTSAVVQGVRVVQLNGGGDGSLTDDRAITVVVAVLDGPAVLSLVHAQRTGDVTIVRSTLAGPMAATPGGAASAEATS